MIRWPSHGMTVCKRVNPDESDYKWLDIEQTVGKDIQISDSSFVSQSIEHHLHFKTLTTAASLTAWWKLHKITNTTFAPSILLPSGTILIS